MRYEPVFRAFSIVVALSLVALAGCGGGGSTDGGSGGSGTAPTPVVTASVVVTPDIHQVARGESTTFTASALDANGAAISGKTFQWSLSSPSVASMADATANPVTLTGLVDGNTRVSAAVDGHSGTATLTVSGAAQIQLSGRVVDAQTGQGIAGATIAVVNGTTLLTAADGSYSVLDRGSATDILVTASKSGYASSQLFAENISDSNTTLETIQLVRSTGSSGTISGTVRNARDNTAIVGASVGLGRGQGPGAGTAAGTATSDAQGHYAFANVAEGTYTVSAAATGFTLCSRTAVSIGTASSSLAQDLSCSPASSTDIRIVLTWGSTPSDLDAHLTGPNPTGSDRFHVYYGVRGSTSVAPFAGLDVDKTTGFGPETVTIARLNGGVYRFSVHDFTNRNSSSSAALAGSGAKVELYLPSIALPQTFFVPSQPGTLWTVFEITGTSDAPVVTPRNSMGFASSPGDVL